MPECRSIICEVAPDTAIYSLSTNLSFNGTPISVVVPCPEGFICPTTTVTYPPGTFIVPDPPPLPPGSDPCTPRPPFRVQGCLSEIIVPIPPCSTAAQIAALAQQVIEQMALQQAQCDTYPPVTPPGGNPPVPIVFTNAAQSVECSNPNNVFNVTALPSIPGITFAGGFLTAAAGIFGYPTQEAADAAAISFLEGLRDELLLDGDATCICFASFTATPGATDITLNWSATPPATEYWIKRATVGPEGPYTLIASHVAGLSYVDTDVVAGTTYYYTIRGYEDISTVLYFVCASDVISAELGAVFAWNLVWGAPFLTPGGTGGSLNNFTGLPASSDISVSNNAAGGMSVVVNGTQNYTSATPVNIRATLNGSISTTNATSTMQWNTVIDSVLHSSIAMSGGDPPWVNVLEDVTLPAGTHLLGVQLACTSDDDGGGAHTSTFTAVLTVLP